MELERERRIHVFFSFCFYSRSDTVRDIRYTCFNNVRLPLHVLLWPRMCVTGRMGDAQRESVQGTFVKPGRLCGSHFM